MLARTFHKIYFISPTSAIDKKIRATFNEFGKRFVVKNVLLEQKIKEELREMEKIKKKMPSTQRSFLHDPSCGSGGDAFGDTLDWRTFMLPEVDFHDDEWFPHPDDILAQSFTGRGASKVYAPSWLDNLLAFQKKVNQKYGDEYMDKVLMIYDDCLESPIMKNKAFRRFAAASRHYNCSCWFAIQNFCSLDKIYRELADNVILFPTGNEKDLDNMFKETNVLKISKDVWMRIYDYCTDDQFNFMQVCFKNDRDHKFTKNFNEFINVDDFRSI